MKILCLVFVVGSFLTPTIHADTKSPYGKLLQRLLKSMGTKEEKEMESRQVWLVVSQPTSITLHLQRDSSAAVQNPTFDIVYWEDPNGKVESVETVDWQGSGGKVTVGGLDPSKSYKIRVCRDDGTRDCTIKTKRPDAGTKRNSVVDGLGDAIRKLKASLE